MDVYMIYVYIYICDIYVYMYYICIIYICTVRSYGVAVSYKRGTPVSICSLVEMSVEGARRGQPRPPDAGLNSFYSCRSVDRYLMGSY